MWWDTSARLPFTLSTIHMDQIALITSKSVTTRWFLYNGRRCIAILPKDLWLDWAILQFLCPINTTWSRNPNRYCSNRVRVSSSLSRKMQVNVKTYCLLDTDRLYECTTSTPFGEHNMSDAVNTLRYVRYIIKYHATSGNKTNQHLSIPKWSITAASHPCPNSTNEELLLDLLSFILQEVDNCDTRFFHEC